MEEGCQYVRARGWEIRGEEDQVGKGRIGAWEGYKGETERSRVKRKKTRESRWRRRRWKSTRWWMEVKI